MGIFYNMIEVHNRAPITLSVRFDGQETNVPPGYSFLPKVCILHAMNQNPIMGKSDANNPNVSGGEYLIAAKGSKYDGPDLTEDEWEEHLGRPCRIDEQEYFAEKLGPKERVVTRGKGRKTQAKSRFDTGVADQRGETIDDVTRVD